MRHEYTCKATTCLVEVRSLYVGFAELHRSGFLLFYVTCRVYMTFPKPRSLKHLLTCKLVTTTHTRYTSIFL